MKKSKSVLKRITAMILIILMIIAIPLSANASSIKVIMPQCKDSDGNLMYYADSSYNANGGRVNSKGEPIWSIYIDYVDDKSRAYCIEPGGALNQGESLEDTSDIWEGFSEDLQKSINIALLYGFNGSPETLVGNSDEKYVATQIIIREISDGCRKLWNDNFKCTNKKYYNAVCSGNSNVNVAKNYKIISDALEQYLTVPSFSSKYPSQAHTYTLYWDGSKYTTTIEDKNGVLDKFNFEAEGIEFKRSGNKLTISSNKPINDSVTASSDKNIPQPEEAGKLIAFGSDDRQDVVYGVSKSDPPKAYFKLETSESQIEVVKRDKDSGETIHLAGFGFKIKDQKGNYITDGTTDTFYTNPVGVANIPVKLNIGTYYIEEVATVGDYQINKEPVKVNLDGSSAVVIVDFYNTANKGKISITKTGGQLADFKETEKYGYTVKQPVWTSENTPLTGAKFRLVAEENISANDGTIRYKKGDVVVEEKEADENGNLSFDDLFYGTYRIEETKAPSGFTKCEPVVVTVDRDNPEVSTNIVNYKQRVKVQVIKELEQDEAGLIDVKQELKNVSYGLYANSPITANSSNTIYSGDLIDVAYADEDGKVTFSVYLPIGSYYVQELTTSEYYNIDGRYHQFKITGDDEFEGTKVVETYTNYVRSTPIVMRKAASDTNAPLAGCEIEIYSDKGTLVYIGTSNAEGVFENIPELIKGIYTYRETKAPEGYLLDTEEHTFEVTGDETEIEITLKDEIILGKIQILKTGEIFTSVTAETDKDGTTTYIPNYKDGSLNGATFDIIADGDIVTPDGTLRYKDGEVVETLTTGEDGTAASGDLYLGSYIIKETEAPNGYSISFDEIKITLSADYTFVTTDKISNVRNKVNVKLHKELEEDENNLVSTEAEITNVSFGIFADEKITGADGSYIPNDGLIEKKYCNASGDITFSADLPNGKYYVKEMSTSQCYKLDDTKHCFTVDNGKELTVEIGKKEDPIVNELITKPVVIKKIAKDTGLPLEGAVIAISTLDGNVFYRGTTQKDGILEGVPELPVGSYKYREISAPEGYIRDENIYTFDISGDEDIIELTLENDIILGKITVVKTGDRFTDVIESIDDEGTTTYQPEYNEGSIEGAEFEIIANEDIVTPDGTIRYKNGEVVETLTTGEDGTATSGDLYLGNYIVKETKAPDEYIISEVEIPIELTPNDHIITTNPVKNSRHTVTVSLCKTMETDNWGIIDTKAEVQKVSFGIFANEDIVADNGTYIPKDGLIQKMNCDEDGVIQFSVALPFGSYYVKELETSELYVLDDTKHYFTIDYSVDAESSIYINLNDSEEFYNQWSKTQIDFKKVAKGTSSPLAGCEIEIKNENGKVVYKGTTGANGKLADVPQLPHGTYTYKELTAPKGYLLDENTYTFTIDGSKRVIELVMENTPITGGIEITKTDITTDKALPNCGIRLLDENGNVIVEKYTDSNGKVLFDNLSVGKYYYQEFDAPEGYKINTEKFPFEIKENGVIIKAVLKDQKEDTTSTTPNTPATPSTPNTTQAPPAATETKVQTGQAVHNYVLIIACAVSAAVVFATSRKMKKLRKGDESTEGEEV